MFRENLESIFPSESHISRLEYQLNLASEVSLQSDREKSDGSGLLKKDRMDSALSSISGID